MSLIPKYVQSRLNTHLFLTFHSIQAPKMIALLAPFFLSLPALLSALRHHSAKLLSLRLGAAFTMPIADRIVTQNSLANTHVVRMCCTFSSSWSHSTHRAGWGRPLRCNRSAARTDYRPRAIGKVYTFRAPKISKSFSMVQRWLIPENRLDQLTCLNRGQRGHEPKKCWSSSMSRWNSKRTVQSW